MKITRRQLRQIINEEQAKLEQLIAEDKGKYNKGGYTIQFDTSDEDAKTSVVTITVDGESVKKKINSGPDQNARSSMNDVVSDHRTTGRWPPGWEPVSVNENLDRVVSINAGDLTQFKGKKRLEIVGAALENLRDAVVQLSERVDKLEVKGSDGS